MNLGGVRLGACQCPDSPGTMSSVARYGVKNDRRVLIVHLRVLRNQNAVAAFSMRRIALLRPLRTESRLVCGDAGTVSNGTAISRQCTNARRFDAARPTHCFSDDHHMRSKTPMAAAALGIPFFVRNEIIGKISAEHVVAFRRAAPQSSVARLCRWREGEAS